MQAKGIDVVPQVSCRPLQMEYQFSAPFPLESMPCMEPVLKADLEGEQRERERLEGQPVTVSGRAGYELVASGSETQIAFKADNPDSSATFAQWATGV